MLRRYGILHEQYGNRIDAARDDLDPRIIEIVRKWLEAMAPPSQNIDRLPDSPGVIGKSLD